MYALEKACGYIENVLEVTSRVRHEHQHDPVPGSTAETERTETSGRAYQHVLDAQTVAGLRVAATEDHMSAIATLVAHPTSVFPLRTLARTAAELSVRAWWLLDPACSPQDRAERGLSEALYSFQEQKQLPGADLHEKAAERRREIASQAGSEGLHVSGDNQRPSSTMQLLRETLDDEDLGSIVYRLLSAHVHGTTYALTQLVRRETAQPTTVEGLGKVMVGTDAANDAQSILMAFMPYARAVRRYFHYNGYPNKQLTGALVYATSELRSHM